MLEGEKKFHKKIAPAAIMALKEALTHIYWYKRDLRSFLSSALNDDSLVSRLNWQDYKRNIVASLIDFLVKHEDKYQRQLLQLMTEVARIEDFSHLTRLDDGADKAKKAKSSVAALKRQIGHLDRLLSEEEEIERRREEAHQKIMAVTAVRSRLEELKQKFSSLVLSDNPQRRGLELEKIVRELFELFDLDPKASFKITGEQIDGAFTFEGTDYLLEAKWQQEPVRASDLDALAGKLSRKLDNTLGLFLSVNGFSEDAVKAHSCGRRLIILMDGSDLMAVLEGRIDLVKLLLRKRRAAAQTGNIYLRIHEILPA